MAKALEVQGMSLDEMNKANAALVTMLQDIDPKIKLTIAKSTDFSKMTDGQPWIGRVRHKTYIDINRRGWKPRARRSCLYKRQLFLQKDSR